MKFLRQPFWFYGKAYEFPALQNVRAVSQLCRIKAVRSLPTVNQCPVAGEVRNGLRWISGNSNHISTARGLSNRIDKDVTVRFEGNEQKLGERKECFNNTEDIGKSFLLRDVLQTLIREITEAGVPEPEESVNLIVAHVCGKKMIHEVNLDVHISKDSFEHIRRLCQKRLDRMPVQYIIEEWDYHDMTLKMEPGVLIPRPETEELGGHIVEEMVGRGICGQYKVLDIGCGTGALSLYILNRLPNTKCVAVDKNKKACDLTQINAETYSLQDRLYVVQGDVFDDKFIKEILDEGPFDIIVSNPPYIPAKDMKELEPEVASYEDLDALCGGEDGLDVIRQILMLSRNILRPETGILWLEVDLSHPDEIEKIVKSNPHYCLQYLETIPDFTNRGRFCKLQIKAQ